ncbi:MAG TPA: hypothetical protein VKN99_04120 [Polyangia bacterium]|nr:hypothetical protein [Polyangia bacterium]
MFHAESAVVTRPPVISIVLALFPNAGCFAGNLAAERGEYVARVAEFDTGCSELWLVESLDGTRYKWRGCGYDYILSCVDEPRSTSTWSRPSTTHADHAAEISGFLVGLLLLGSVHSNPQCQLVSTYPSPRPEALRGSVPRGANADAAAFDAHEDLRALVDDAMSRHLARSWDEVSGLPKPASGFDAANHSQAPAQAQDPILEDQRRTYAPSCAPAYDGLGQPCVH